MDREEFNRIEQNLIEAINESSHTYRTVRGIAKDTQLDPLAISEVIYTSKQIIKSRKHNQRNEDLFTTFEKVENMPVRQQMKDILSGSF